jgi:hypothetical protein
LTAISPHKAGFPNVSGIGKRKKGKSRAKRLSEKHVKPPSV